MIARHILALLAFFAVVNAQTCNSPYPAPDNSTVVHPVYFPTGGTGNDSAVIVGNDGTITITAKVHKLQTFASEPELTLSRILGSKVES